MKNIFPCPICGAGETVEIVSEEEQSFGNVACKVKVHARQCTVCTSEFAGELESRLNKREMVALKKRALGLLSGKRVKELRMKWDLTIAQADQVFGGGPVAFSKYEHDDLCQSAQMDKLLVGADKFPDFFAHLCLSAGVRIGALETHVGARVETSTTVLPSDDIALEALTYYPKQFRKKDDLGEHHAR